MMNADKVLEDLRKLLEENNKEHLNDMVLNDESGIAVSKNTNLFERVLEDVIASYKECNTKKIEDFKNQLIELSKNEEKSFIHVFLSIVEYSSKSYEKGLLFIRQEISKFIELTDYVFEVAILHENVGTFTLDGYSEEELESARYLLSFLSDEQISKNYNEQSFAIYTDKKFNMESPKSRYIFQLIEKNENKLYQRYMIDKISDLSQKIDLLEKGSI